MTGRALRVSAALAVVLAAAWGLRTIRTAAQETPGAVLVDGFDAVEGWSAHPADGVDLAARSEGGALRLDFDFHGGGGYAVVRREVALDLPGNYAFSFRIRGEAPPNHLEFKLIDAGGDNVWWSVRRDVAWPVEWETFVVKRRHITFAWGPLGGGEIRHAAAIELAITAGSGGKGSVWIDDLELRPLPLPDAVPPPPAAVASSARPGHGAERAIDGDPATFWSPGLADDRPWIALDLGKVREYGGLVVDWGPGRHAFDYAVEASDDGNAWRAMETVTGGNGGRDHLYLPDSDSRFLRVRPLPGPGYEGVNVVELVLKPLAWSSSREVFFGEIAGDAPRGAYPRGIAGEQPFWTVVGVDDDPREGLLGEDGAIEAGMGKFSVEPFLRHGDRFWSWSDVRAEQTLEEGYLPIPTVRWTAGDLELAITAFGTGEPGASSIAARYVVTNRRGALSPVTLYLALRPFQVNPPSQTLNHPGGTAPVRTIAFEGTRVVRVNGEIGVVSMAEPSAFGAATFAGGDVVADHLLHGRMPGEARVEDGFEAASGALAYAFELPPGGSREIDLLVPLYPESPVPPGAGPAWIGEELSRSREAWSERLERVELRLPDREVVETLRSQIGYILVNRAGPAIRPGARAYARSWIRDGALTSSALLRLGHAGAARAFLEWYAPHQYPNGKIPCVVDHRGADPVPEHDSSGEFIFLAAEVHRFTGDRELAERMWPRVRAAAAYLDSLRQERRTEDYRDPARAEFFGILPPSISHEGYSAKPMHSYWDDFFALRGFKDAVYLAGELGLVEERARLARIRDEFQRDLGASIEAAMRRHGIDYVPGCADLGDFDPTSTTIALAPAGAGGILPRDALERTFERYYTFFVGRREGEPWEAYTPYEIRNAGAFVRLGWRERARELLAFFLSDRKPVGWNQWPEVVWREDRVPRFLGDLPHTWVGSDYARSILAMLAYEREDPEALVLGAGVPREWLGPGVVVGGLPTPYGEITFTMGFAGEGGAVEIVVDGDLRIPPGGIVVRAPVEGAVREATVNGGMVTPLPDGGVVVRALPARVVVR